MESAKEPRFHWGSNLLQLTSVFIGPWLLNPTQQLRSGCVAAGAWARSDILPLLISGCRTGSGGEISHSAKFQGLRTPRTYLLSMWTGPLSRNTCKLLDSTSRLAGLHLPQQLIISFAFSCFFVSLMVTSTSKMLRNRRSANMIRLRSRGEPPCGMHGWTPDTVTLASSWLPGLDARGSCP